MANTITDFIPRVGEFEKVSFDEFYTATAVDFPDELPSIDDVREIYEAICLPVRASAGSAGFDFHIPYGIELAPGESVRIATGIRCQIESGWWLACLPRSGLGFKYRVQLDNTVGVIDSDYYDSSNEGHIHLKITNDSRTGKTLNLRQGDAFAQAIFLPYGLTYSDDVSAKRDGGFGSTDR